MREWRQSLVPREAGKDIKISRSQGVQRRTRRARVATAVLFALAGPGIASATVVGQVDSAGDQGVTEVRIVARKVAGGTIELGLQQRHPGDSWGERLLPARRYFPTGAATGRWRSSSSLTLSFAVLGSAATTDGVVRIVARRLSDDDFEIGLQQHRTEDGWGERLLPAQRIFPSASPVGRWLSSSPMALTVTDGVRSPTSAPDTAASTIGLGVVPAAQVVTAGRVLEVDVSALFTGIVDTYAAESSEESVLSVSMSASRVVLRGESAGTATVTVVARTGTATASQSFPVTVEALEPLRIAVVTQSACLLEGGDMMPDGVEGPSSYGPTRIEVFYTVLGGRGPYEIASPDALVTATSPRGVLAESCAVRETGPDGVERVPETPHEVVDKVVQVRVTDADGATASAEVVLESVDYSNFTGCPEAHLSLKQSYVLGTTNAWTILTLPADLVLRLEGLDAGGVAHFADATTGSAVWVDWETAIEIARELTVPIVDLPDNPRDCWWYSPPQESMHAADDSS